MPSPLPRLAVAMTRVTARTRERTLNRGVEACALERPLSESAVRLLNGCFGRQTDVSYVCLRRTSVQNRTLSVRRRSAHPCACRWFVHRATIWQSQPRLCQRRLYQTLVWRTWSAVGTLRAGLMTRPPLGAPQRRHKMTKPSLSQITTAMVAALVTSTLFISAAIAPAAQFV